MHMIKPLGLQEYQALQSDFMKLLPKEVESGDAAYGRRDVRPDEMVRNLGAFYLNRDLGPFYCFLPSEVRERKRARFSERHFNVGRLDPGKHPGAAELGDRLDYIREEARVASSPEELLKLYTEFWGIVWSNHRGFNAGQIGKVYDNEYRAQRKRKCCPILYEQELEEINSEIHMDGILIEDIDEKYGIVSESERQ